jgi:hypothetical protein
MSRTTVRGVLVALVVGLVGWSPSSALAVTGTLLYSCSGPGFGTGPYPFTAVIDSEVPDTVPYGTEPKARMTVQLVAPDAFRQWAVDQGFTTLFPGARLTPAVDNVALAGPSYAAGSASSVPTTPGSWTWNTVGTDSLATKLPGSAVGHHVLTTSLEVTVAFQKNGVNAWAASAACTLDASVPAADAVVDQYDVVAATTTTAVTVTGDIARATVTSNGAPPVGTVSFNVSGTSVVAPLVSGKATATLPVVPPGPQTVKATFVPTQPTQLTTSVGTAAYTAPRFATTSTAKATYLDARDLLKARAIVVGADGNPATGRVTFLLKRFGVTVAHVTVRLSEEGVAKHKFRHVTRRGVYLVQAKYLGDPTYQRSSDRSARLSI